MGMKFLLQTSAKIANNFIFMKKKKEEGRKGKNSKKWKRVKITLFSRGWRQKRKKNIEKFFSFSSSLSSRSPSFLVQLYHSNFSPSLPLSCCLSCAMCCVIPAKISKRKILFQTSQDWERIASIDSEWMTCLDLPDMHPNIYSLPFFCWVWVFTVAKIRFYFFLIMEIKIIQMRILLWLLKGFLHYNWQFC